MANLSDMSGLQAQPPADPRAALRQRLLAGHAQARAQFDATSDLVGRADRARVGLTALATLGDMITPDDVVKEAGKLVAGGEDPLALAGLLADMPPAGGEALAAWVAQHAQAAAITEQKVLAAHAATKHQLGVSAMHVLQAHSAGAPAQPHSAELPLTAPNALT